MTKPSYQTRSFQSREGGHKIVYSDWGPEGAQPLICIHGLTGNGFDFDYIAPGLVEDGYRVIAVDLPGRGRSDFLSDPMAYNYDQYCADLWQLLDELGVNDVDWLGVSLGGLLGIRMAGAQNSPIRRLILNDIGPEVPQEALDFIYQVIAQAYLFNSIEELELRMRATRGLSWGPITDEQWKHMAAHNNRAIPEGGYSYAYDPAIARVFESEPIGAVDLWPLWAQITCPTLVLRGGQSMLLLEKHVKKMRENGPDFDYHVFAGCGHVPSLMAPEQIAVVREWLYKTKP